MKLTDLTASQDSASSYQLKDDLIERIQEGKNVSTSDLRKEIEKIIRQAKSEVLANLLCKVESEAANLM